MGYGSFPGNEKVKELLKKMTLSETLPQALLLKGERLTFKEEIAQELARALLCSQGAEEACGVCPLCRLFGRDEEGRPLTPPDMLILDPPGDLIKIDEVREAIRFIGAHPMVAPKKVVVISDMDRMNQEAQNAFLKVLEEPHPYVNYIMTTGRIDTLLPTILSRSQVFSLQEPKERDLLDYFGLPGREELVLLRERGFRWSEIPEGEKILFSRMRECMDPLFAGGRGSAVAAVKLKELWEEAGREESKRVLRLLLSLAMERGRSLLAEVVKERGKEPRQREVRELLLKTEAIYRESFSNASAEVLLAAFLSSFL